MGGLQGNGMDRVASGAAKPRARTGPHLVGRESLAEVWVQTEPARDKFGEASKLRPTRHRQLCELG